MRTDICNDLPKCRIIFILTAMMIMFGTNNLFAQSNPIYQNGNVIVYQYSHGWEIMHGNNLVGYGDGELDMETLHPAFKELIVLQMKSSTSRCEIHLNKSGVFVVVVAGRSFKVMLSE